MLETVLSYLKLLFVSVHSFHSFYHCEGLSFSGLSFPGLSFPGLSFPGLSFPGLRS